MSETPCSGTDSTPASVPAGRIPAASADRVLAEFRASSDAVAALYDVHAGNRTPGDVELASIERGLAYVNSVVVLALDHGSDRTEHLYCQPGENGPEWYSIMNGASGRTHGPISLYRSDVSRRLGKDHAVSVVRTDRSLYADREIPAHSLGRDACVDVDASEEVNVDA